MAGPYPMPPDKDGGPRWRVYVYGGVDSLTGKPRQITKVVRGTKREAQKVLTSLQAETDRGAHAGTRARTFGDALAAYLDQKSVSVEATTNDTYRAHLVYIPERLQKMPVGNVGVEHLEALYTHLRRHGAIRTGGPLGAKTIRNVHTIIKGALEQARRWKWITENPADQAELPSAPAREPSPTPADKIVELIRRAADIHHAFPAYVRTSACAGGRRSEMHGLRWSGVNWDRNRITIQDVIVRAGRAWVIKPYPKTGGRRVVVLDPGTIELLRVVHAQALDNAMACGIALPPNAFVFTDTVDGSTTWKPQTTARWFKRICDQAGVTEGTRPHDLRHLMATHLIDEGLPIPAASGRLGHSQSSTTLDIYTAGVPLSDELAAGIMGRLLDG